MTRTRTCLLLAGGLAAGLLLGSATGAQEPDAGFERYFELAKPGPEHGKLDRLTGEWNVVAEIRTMPMTTPTVTHSSATHEWVLGGRFLEMKTDGSFMGQPFSSLQFVGFDRGHEQFVLVGMDTLGTYFVTAKGPKPAGSGPIVMEGVNHDAVMDIEQKYKVRLDIVSADKFTLAWEMEFPGRDPYDMVQLTYTRRR